ncbi:ATP-binding protein [Acrocarpospora sp. B8E8]|uniref:ATP-binding protein n=1 Tax=Acrocarpospora sp. B8E8 TaxID=3153572 RepID=UPI00325DB4C2
MREIIDDEPQPDLVCAGVRGRSFQGRCIGGRSFSSTPDQVPRVRALARALLADTPFAQDGELIAAELATNAIAHAPRSGSPDGSVILECLLHPGEVRIAVYDQGGGVTPIFAAPMRLSEHGYGLRGVALWRLGRGAGARERAMPCGRSSPGSSRKTAGPGRPASRRT